MMSQLSNRRRSPKVNRSTTTQVKQVSCVSFLPAERVAQRDQWCTNVDCHSACYIASLNTSSRWRYWNISAQFFLSRPIYPAQRSPTTFCSAANETCVYNPPAACTTKVSELVADEWRHRALFRRRSFLTSNSLRTSFSRRVPLAAAVKQWWARMAEGNVRFNPTFLRGLAPLKSSRPVLCHVTSGKEARKNHSTSLTTKRRRPRLQSESEWKTAMN